MKHELFWVAVGPFGLGTGPDETKITQKPIGPPLDHFWISFQSVWAIFDFPQVTLYFSFKKLCSFAFIAKLLSDCADSLYNCYS